MASIRTLFVPFFLQSGNAVGYSTHMMPVQVEYRAGERGTPQTASQGALRDEGYWNRILLVEGNVIVKRYFSDPKAIATVASRYGNPRHENSPAARVAFLEDTSNEFAWVLRMGVARERLLAGWLNYSNSVGTLLESLLPRHRQHILYASRVMAQVYFLAGHITKDMRDFHMTTTDTVAAQWAEEEDRTAVIADLKSALERLDAASPAQAKAYRASVRKAITSKTEASPSGLERRVEVMKDDVSATKVDRKKEPNRASMAKAIAAEKKAEKQAALKKAKATAKNAAAKKASSDDAAWAKVPRTATQVRVAGLAAATAEQADQPK